MTKMIAKNKKILKKNSDTGHIGDCLADWAKFALVWFGFTARVSYSSGWSRTRLVVKDGLELLNLWIPSPECCDHRQVPSGRDLARKRL